MNKYDDIINLKHYEPKYHQRMSITNRASQFAPFSALVGYEDGIKESSRFLDNKKIMMEDMKVILDNKFMFIKEHLKENIKVTVIYFVGDEKKNGGEYLEYSGIIKSFDMVDKKIIFKDKKQIVFDDIIGIDID